MRDLPGPALRGGQDLDQQLAVDGGPAEVELPPGAQALERAGQLLG
ncbi:hypothetical protein [Nonomuraea dietziae]